MFSRQHVKRGKLHTEHVAHWKHVAHWTCGTLNMCHTGPVTPDAPGPRLCAAKRMSRRWLVGTAEYQREAVACWHRWVSAKGGGLLAPLSISERRWLVPLVESSACTRAQRYITGRELRYRTSVTGAHISTAHGNKARVTGAHISPAHGNKASVTGAHISPAHGNKARVTGAHNIPGTR